MYQLFYQLAIAAAGAVMIVEGRRRRFDLAQWLPLVLLWAVGGVVGAQLPHMMLGDAAAPRTAVGAVAGATIVLFGGTLLTRFSSGAALDATAVAIPIGGAFARLGCFAADCCSGIVTNLPIGVVGDDGARHHATQLYEASFDAAVAAWLTRRRSPRADGHQFLTSLGLISAGRFMIEFVRDSEKIGGLSLAQWIVGPFAILCFAAVVLEVRFPRAKACAAPRLAFTGLAAVMLQMPAPVDSTFPQRFRFWGLGLGHGGYSLDHETFDSCDADSPNEWSRFHKYFGGSVEGGYMRQGSEWSGVTYRGRASYSIDVADRPIAKRGSAPNPNRYHTTNVSAGGFVDFNAEYAALTLGATLGHFRPALAGFFVEENDPVDAWAGTPAVGIRLGPLFGPSAELRFGDEAPLSVPLPMLSLAVGIGDRKGNRVRLGVSDGGYFAAGTFKASNGRLEIVPSLYLMRTENQGRQGGAIGVRQWTKLPAAGR